MKVRTSGAKFRKVRSACSVGPRLYCIHNPADLSSLQVSRIDPAAVDLEQLARSIEEAKAKQAQGSYFEPPHGMVNPFRYSRPW